MPLINLPPFAEALAADLARLNTMRVDTPVIQPADPFLDMAGENLRRRIFMTQSETGKSLCLRPEFTIPVCLRHIETATGTPRRYAYLGQVFRQRREGENEFYQAGIEDLGEADVAGADARAIGDAITILKARLPGRTLTVTLGDQAVFEAVVAACGLPAGWQKRLVHAFGNSLQIEALLRRLSSPQPVTGLSNDIEALLAAENDQGLIDHIDATMEATGYSTNASRSPKEIVERLKEKRALEKTALEGRTLGLLRRFLSLSIPLAAAPAALFEFADTSGLRLDRALSRFDARVAALGNAGVDPRPITYRAAFGRPLDYYTGLVFEITLENSPAVLAGGGRFDRLMTLLGAKERIPAVGFALWLDRIEAALAQHGEAA